MPMTNSKSLQPFAGGWNVIPVFLVPGERYCWPCITIFTVKKSQIHGLKISLRILFVSTPVDVCAMIMCYG